MLVRLDGFEGPLDLLLDLARRQEVDLSRISVLALVDQYLAAIERLGVAATGLERAADWLVMAAWLTWLKSRLLLPKNSREGRHAARAGGVLLDRLAQIEHVRALAAWLEARPQLGRETYARGAPESVSRTVVSDLPTLFRACLLGLHWQPPIRHSTVPPQPILWRVSDAIARLHAMIGAVPDGTELTRFFPPHLFASSPPVEDQAISASASDRGMDLPLQRRGAVATTLLGALELAREAHIHLRQNDSFGPILVHPAARAEQPEQAP